MPARPLTRATVVALAFALSWAGIAAADTAPGDADLVAPGPQMSRDLGVVAPGATVVTDVGFVLTCAGLAHVDHGQTVTFTPGTTTVPGGGAITATSGAVGPVPDGWPVDGDGCPSPLPVLAAATSSHVTLTTPTAPKTHTFTVVYDRSVAPAGPNDAAALTRTTAIDLVLTVQASPTPTPTPTQIGRASCRERV